MIEIPGEAPPALESSKPSHANEGTLLLFFSPED
jgi:hypothetical protein